MGSTWLKLTLLSFLAINAALAYPRLKAPTNPKLEAMMKAYHENFLGTHGKRSADEPMEMTDEEALAYLVAKLSTPTGFFLKPGKRGNDLIKRRYIPGGMFEKKDIFDDFNGVRG